MNGLSAVLNKMEEIRNSDFVITEESHNNKNYKVNNLFRKALLCYNAIIGENDLSDDEKETLKNELEEIMKSKLKEIYPDFDEELLNKILYGYKRGYIVYPMDVFVIDDAVFHKETIYDDFGFIHEIKTFMFHGMEPYYDIFSEYFTLDEDDFIFSSNGNECFTKEDDKYTSAFISDMINLIYNGNIAKPSYKCNTNQDFYDYSGVVNIGIQYVNIYINKKTPRKLGVFVQ